MKPCPFCGSEHVTAANDHVVCEACWANGPHSDGKDDAIAKWNDRSRFDGVVEAKFMERLMDIRDDLSGLIGDEAEFFPED